MDVFARFARIETKESPFGPLEWRVLDALWARSEPSSVRDLKSSFPAAAYSTIMTTLERLHVKGALARVKRGRAFYYQPNVTRAEFKSGRAAAALHTALQGDAAELGPLMSFFVEAVSDRDRDLLDDLEALVRSRRAELEQKNP